MCWYGAQRQSFLSYLQKILSLLYTQLIIVIIIMIIIIMIKDKLSVDSMESRELLVRREVVPVWGDRRSASSSGERVRPLSLFTEPLLPGDLLEQGVPQSFAQSYPFCRVILEHPGDQVKQLSVVFIVHSLIPLKKKINTKS